MSSPARTVPSTSVPATSPSTIAFRRQIVLFWNVQNWHSTKAVSPKTRILSTLLLKTGAHYATLCECMESLDDLTIEKGASNPSLARSTRQEEMNRDMLAVQATLKDEKEGLFRYEAYQASRYATEEKSSEHALGYATIGIQKMYCSIVNTIGYQSSNGRAVDTTNRRQLLCIDQPHHPLVFVVHMVAAGDAALSQLLSEIIPLVIVGATGRPWIIVGDMNVDADILAAKPEFAKFTDPSGNPLKIIHGGDTHGHASGVGKILDYAIATARCRIEVVSKGEIIDAASNPTSDHLPIVLTYEY